MKYVQNLFDCILGVPAPMRRQSSVDHGDKFQKPKKDSLAVDSNCMKNGVVCNFIAPVVVALSQNRPHPFRCGLSLWIYLVQLLPGRLTAAALS
jgi:hypothetical protein